VHILSVVREGVPPLGKNSAVILNKSIIQNET